MSIYHTLLGDDFLKLHPKLQARYTLPLGEPFYAVGKMSKIETGAYWLKPLLKLATRWNFLFPESGKDVPFTIKNTCRSLSTGEEEIYWERTFYFKEVKRHFNASMTIDADRRVVRDYLGEPNLFYSDLMFKVTPDGSLHISSGYQRLVMGLMEIPIPQVLRGVVTVEEGYDDVREVFTIQVFIHNRIVGRIMAYEGEFEAQSF
ncbi:DUF4166 domain-containing protein [Sutcliffiella deserti]|uniref:DUF4166 domain-containing protein n=1 Tax=Sutcliffiella deserti TaxID=2875501 RepID=UPI001CBB0B04|nr:DUF4166 domain-containing protein [Sutcliffiella deserti]